MRYTKQIQISFLVVALTCAPVVCSGQMVLGLDKTFIENIKDKATISTRFTSTPFPLKQTRTPLAKGPTTAIFTWQAAIR